MSQTSASALLALLIVAVLAAAGRLRTVADEFATAPRRAVAWFLLWLVLLASVAMPAVVAGNGDALAAEDLSFPGLFAGHALLSAFLFAWWRLRRPISLAAFLHLRGASRSDVAGGLALGFRVWLFTLVTAALVGIALQLLLDLDGTAAATAEIPAVPDVMLWMVELPVAGKLLVVLAAMTVEEAFFRAFLQSRVGLLWSSVLFAIAHASYGMPTLMVGVFVVSILIGIDFARHGRLLRCILAHGVFDAIQLLVIVPFAVEQLQQ